MIDQIAIAVLPDRIQIKPQHIEVKADMLGDWFLPLRRRREDDAKKTEKAMYPVYHCQFDLFADGALRVYTRSRERSDTKQSEQFINYIELNLRKILWGHNGVNLYDGADLCHALLIVRHSLSHLLVDSSQASELIPGIGEKKISYWHKMELAMDVRDPGLVIRRRMEWMRSPSVRRNPKFYQNTTLLDGKNVGIKAYDKIEQMKDRHKTPRRTIDVASDPITRLEVRLKRDKVTDFSKLKPDDTPAVSVIAGRSRLTGFTWAQLRAIHRSYFSMLKAVYHVSAEKGGRPEDGYAAVLAAIALEHDIAPDSIYDLLMSYSGKADSTCRNIRDRMERHIGQRSELTAEELLSDENYSNQPGLHVPGLNGCQFYVHHYGWSEIAEAMPEMRKVYGDASPKPFLDTAGKPYLLWEFTDALR